MPACSLQRHARRVPDIIAAGASQSRNGWCISFGGLNRSDVAAEILKAVEGNAIEAALEVAARAAEQQSNGIARSHWNGASAYEALLAARRYEAVDPDNRLVAGELERVECRLSTVER